MIFNFAFILFFFLLSIANLKATELYSFPSLEQAEIKTPNKKKKESTPFVLALAKKTETPEDYLTELTEKGLGRMELVRLILTSKKSTRPLPDLVRDRELGMRLSKIAENVKQDNALIRKEAKTLLAAVLKEADNISQTLALTKTAIAGTNGNDFKTSATNYTVLTSSSATPKKSRP